MNRKYLAFDIEIFNDIPDGTTDWKALRPLGISCAATLASGEDRPELWHGEEKARPMNQVELREMLSYMAYAVNEGYTIVTWNGLSFDFDVLAEETGIHAKCAELAMNHIDMMFHFFCLKGFPLGLDACAKGCGLTGKTEGMSGAKAPQLWQAGEYDKVLEYVGQDVITTLAVAEAVERQKGFDWISKKGRVNSIRINQWKTVAEALQLPEPDTSWMSDPWPRSKFTEWMNETRPVTPGEDATGNPFD
jgi:hypothetical protein